MIPATFLLTLAIVLGSVLGLWLLSLALHDASIADIFWGLGFVVIGWSSVACSSSASNRKWLVAALTTVWGLRLAAYLGWRSIGRGEDHRYQTMRAGIGKRFWIVSLATVFGLQGILMWIVSFPVQTAILSDIELWWLDLLGATVVAVGVWCETVGDFQLARFKADPAQRGQVCDRGLWRFTRHPNYFGDFLVWWGLFLIAVSGGAWWTVFSPLLMSLLLMRVSGVTLLEKSLVNRRPGYADYVRRTNAFFPWWPSGASVSKSLRQVSVAIDDFEEVPVRVAKEKPIERSRPDGVDEGRSLSD